MRTWVKATLAGVLALGPGIALGAIDNTHHDMVYLGIGNSTEKCAYCHSKTGLTGGDPNLLKVGNFCVLVCHTGGTTAAIARPETIPTGAGTFDYSSGAYSGNATSTSVTNLTQGHGMSQLILAGFDSAERTALQGTGWPYTQAGSNDIQCTSCHAVHDATNPPFLNAKLTDGSQGGGFCQKCHNSATRQQVFTAGAGNHPIEFKWDVTAASTRTATKTDGTVMNRRELAIATQITNINVVATAVGDTATATALNATGAHWNTGGHLLNTSTGLPTTAAGQAQFTCVSCHTAHIAASASSGNASGPDNALLPGARLKTVCYGCHTTEPGTTNYGHPIGDEVPLANALWSAIPLSATYNALAQEGANNAVRPVGTAAPWCVSCHDVHGGLSGRMAIRSTLGTLNADGAVCELCHPTSFANPTTANQHHPGAASTTDYTANGFPTNASWQTQDGLGDLNDGLSCPDCHVGDGTATKRATAHNWN